MTDKNMPTAILSFPETEAMARAASEKLKDFDKKTPREHIYVPLDCQRFSDGEVKPHVTGSVRSHDVYLFATMYPAPNDRLVEFALACNAIRLASGRSITAVVPYIGYTRQDRKDEPRVPISARVIANIIEMCPLVQKVVTFDLHVEQEEGFFSIPVDHIPGRVLHAPYFAKQIKDPNKVVIIAPDVGSSKRVDRFAKQLAKILGVPRILIGILTKDRGTGEVEHINYIGPPLDGMDVIVYDDIIATAGTTVSAVNAIRKLGAKSVTVGATHGVFNVSKEGIPAEERLFAASVQVVSTNTIPRGAMYQNEHSSWLTMLPADDLIAEVLWQSEIPEGSVSNLLR